MNRAAQQMHRQLLSWVAVFLVGGALWAGELQLVTWWAEWMVPGSVERDGDTVRTGGGLVGILAGGLLILGFCLLAGGLLWILFLWPYKCPKCAARAKLVGKTKLDLKCTACDYREATGYFRD